MDILIYMTLITVITILFVLLKYSQSPFLYIGILMLSSLGLILSVSSDVYITKGYTTTVTDSNYDTFTVQSTPIIEDLGIWQYMLQLFYLGGLITTVVLWSIGDD